MAARKRQRKTQPVRSRPADSGSLWLAAVGAASLARKQGKKMVGEMVGEGRRLQTQAGKVARETRKDIQAQVIGVIKPVRARFAQQARRTRAAVKAGVAGALAGLGIPSKADIEQLSQRVGTLSRQLKAK